MTNDYAGDLLVALDTAINEHMAWTLDWFRAAIAGSGFDSGDLNDAIDKDIKSVGQLFSLDDTGLTDKFQDLTELYAESLEGLLKEKKDSLMDQRDYYRNRVEGLEQRIEGIEKRLSRKFSDMEVAISMLQAQGQSLGGLGIFK